MLSNYLCLVSLTWYDTWLYQTSNKTLVLSVTLPTVRTHCARRDAPFGSVLFLSAIPILPPAVGFPASYPPLCLLLIKHAPVGRRGEGGVGGGWEGSFMHVGDATSLHVFAWSLKHAAPVGQLLHSCTFFTLSCTSSHMYSMLFLFRSWHFRDGPCFP